MEVMEFKRKYEMICKAYKGDCAMCPLSNYCNMLDEDLYISKVSPELIRIVNNVADELLISRQELFLEQYPNTERTLDGVIIISPCVIDPTRHNSTLCLERNCKACREQFWDELTIRTVHNAREE